MRTLSLASSDDAKANYRKRLEHLQSMEVQSIKNGGLGLLSIVELINTNNAFKAVENNTDESKRLRINDQPDRKYL